MIKLDISLAVFIYLFGTVVLVFLFWVWLEKKQDLGVFKTGGGAKQCSICSYMYTDLKIEDFSRCPRCNSINQKEVREA